MRAFPPLTCENGNGPNRCVNTDPGLTHHLMRPGRGLRLMVATASPPPPRGGYVYTESGNRRRAWKPAKSVARRMRQTVYARDDYTCQHCGYRVDPAEIPPTFDWNTSPGNLSLDHVVPYSAGGGFTEDNLQTLCLPCNMRKGAKV